MKRAVNTPSIISATVKHSSLLLIGFQACPSTRHLPKSFWLGICLPQTALHTYPSKSSLRLRFEPKLNKASSRPHQQLFDEQKWRVTCFSSSAFASLLLSEPANIYFGHFWCHSAQQHFSMLFKFVAVCSLAAVALGYPSGAPEGTCATLTPKHQVGAQNSKSSHVIYVSPNAVRGGTPTSVTLQGSTFRGFLIVARDANTEQPVQGTWASLDGTSKALKCGITHTANVAKSQVNAQFTPSRSFRGQLVFRAAVVQDIDTFWNNVASEIISVS